MPGKSKGMHNLYAARVAAAPIMSELELAQARMDTVAIKANAAGRTWACRELDKSQAPGFRRGEFSPILGAKRYLRASCKRYTLAEKLQAERSFKAAAEGVLSELGTRAASAIKRGAL